MRRRSSALDAPSSAPLFPFRIRPFGTSPQGDLRTNFFSSGSIGLLALLGAGGLLLIHAFAGLGEPDLTHVEAAAMLLAIVGLAGLSGRLTRTARPDRVVVEDDPGQDRLIAQLRQEKDAAEAASAAKSRYLASVSHEIRSPLNAIYGYAQLMERGGAVDPTDAARVIRRSAEHLTNLVEGLLDISLIENGMLRISSDVVRLAPFLDQLAAMFRHEAGAKGLQFRYDRPARLPEFVRMDEKRLKQVLINLLSNAIKFTATGSVTLRVRFSGPLATFEVSDTGPGVAAEDRDRIFMPFERGGTHQPGLGLGLSISRALVHIQGGELELESEPGVGATFRLCLMMNEVTGGPVDAEASAPVIGYEGPRRSILIVDDTIDQLSLMRGVLEPLGFDVTTASEGETALTLCAAGHFDLALLDIAMPGLSGWEVAKHMRQHCGAALRILMLSANAQERHGPAEGEPVHDRFLTKPVQLGALLDAVGSLLSLRWIHEEIAAEPQPPARSEALPEAALPHADKLRELLRIGHVRGIESEIKLLAETAPGSGEMIARLYACLDRFDLPALRATLDEYR